MNLRAVFDNSSLLGGDLLETLQGREIVGTWKLKSLDKTTNSKFIHIGEPISLPDGSQITVSAQCNMDLDEPQTAISVSADKTILAVIVANGQGKLSGMVPTGSGGFLTLEFWFDRVEPGGRA